MTLVSQPKVVLSFFPLLSPKPGPCSYAPPTSFMTELDAAVLPVNLWFLRPPVLQDQKLLSSASDFPGRLPRPFPPPLFRTVSYRSFDHPFVPHFVFLCRRFADLMWKRIFPFIDPFIVLPPPSSPLPCLRHSFQLIWFQGRSVTFSPTTNNSEEVLPDFFFLATFSFSPL